jgi:hypothetical protein
VSPPAFCSTVDGERDAIAHAIDQCVDMRIPVFDDQGLVARHANDDAAGFILSPTIRAILVKEEDSDTLPPTSKAR